MFAAIARDCATLVGADIYVCGGKPNPKQSCSSLNKINFRPKYNAGTAIKLCINGRIFIYPLHMYVCMPGYVGMYPALQSFT
jgi:hypothetical protein